MNLTEVYDVRQSDNKIL